MHAIVAEGGGQRGIYTAGVLDAFQAAGFCPFELGIGVSAGAQNLLSYFLSVPGYARRAIADLTSSSTFYVPYRWIGTRSVIDLDGYFDHISNNPSFRLPVEALDGLQQGVGGLRRRLEFVATRQDTFAPLYLAPDSQSVYEDMRATSAVPLLYRGRVVADGVPVIDGGVADPLPLARALALGATQVLVIRTVPVEDSRPGWRQRFDALGLMRAVPAPMRAMLATHDQAYGSALALLDSERRLGRVLEIAPDAPLLSSMFGSPSAALQHDYERGLVAGQASLPTLQDWLGVRDYDEGHHPRDRRA